MRIMIVLGLALLAFTEEGRAADVLPDVPVDGKALMTNAAGVPDCNCTDAKRLVGTGAAVYMWHCTCMEGSDSHNAPIRCAIVWAPYSGISPNLECTDQDSRK